MLASPPCLPHTQHTHTRTHATSHVYTLAHTHTQDEERLLMVEQKRKMEEERRALEKAQRKAVKAQQDVILNRKGNRQKLSFSMASKSE